MIRQVHAAVKNPEDVILGTSVIDTTPTTAELSQKQKTRRTRGYNPPEWRLIGQVQGELRGRENRNSYWLYHNENDDQLVGVIKNPRGSIVAKISLGKFDDPNSKIAQLTKSVKSMASDIPFARRELIEILPSSLSTGNFLKFAMHYLVETGTLKKLKERDIATGAIRYVRREVVGGSSQQSGEDAARATVGLQ